mgnify:CR=1 FL=1
MFATVMGHMEGSTEILAAYTIAGNVEKICMVFSFGIAATAAIIIGREIGAGRTDQVYNTGLTLNTLAALCGACLGVLLWLFARFVAPVWVFPLFHLSEGAESVATMMITVMALYMTLKDFNSVNIVGVLRGGGDVRAATLIDIGPLWTCAIPYAAICGLVLRLPVFWVYLAFPLEQIIKIMDPDIIGSDTGQSILNNFVLHAMLQECAAELHSRLHIEFVVSNEYHALGRQLFFHFFNNSSLFRPNRYFIFSFAHSTPPLLIECSERGAAPLLYLSR